MVIDKQELAAKKKKLEECKEYLKTEFIGIDNIIDDLINYIEIWYLIPEILNRPIIVNLWGMTGVGKTDLIRKMVKFIDFQDRFAEIELSNIDQSGWSNSVSQILENYEINDEKPSIVLFDEIQRFNTLDEEGRPMPQTKFTDFWELLSDGRLSRKERQDLDYILFNYMNRKKDKERRKARGEDMYDEGNSVSLWDAKDLKKNLSLDSNYDELTELTESQVVDLILQSKKKKKIYEPINHSKSLIIISGNLDEAFRMADQTSEADVDADIFHAFTKKITLVDIKNALSRKFRPEQVARFGNIHLIYNSLRRIDFENLIEKEIQKIIKDRKEKLGIDITITKKMNELIYNNGVFPVQGVRPVFSSIIDILESCLNQFVFTAIINDFTTIHIDYNKKEQRIEALVGNVKSEYPYVGRIDKIRESNLDDVVANISVHEAGHAVVYMKLMGLAPLQLKSKIASSYAGGFTFPHQIYETKENIINKIKIYLAGGIAEEIIFGKQKASVGRSHDRDQITVLASDYFRRFGFDDAFQAVYSLEAYPYKLDSYVTDAEIEKMIAQLVVETNELLMQNIDLLKDISRELANKGSLDSSEIAKIAKKHKIEVEVREEGYLHIYEYKKKMME
ncbi:MAG: AAA family ATPase [Raineya sp.]|jgi:cell division protease FtsH|nr:AAA family ATPase [Raineya sp.]